jgi:hypothetical protein
MTMRTFTLVLAAFIALPGLAAAQQAPAQGQGQRLRGADFAGFWASQPGGRAGVEIRVSGAQIVARELFNTQAAGRCGTEGRGRLTGFTSRLNFRGRCSDGSRTSETWCSVTLESRDRISSRCGNGHRMTLHRVRG